MGKRYYCDYCDRSFIDDLVARKKHLNGTLHIRNKNLHFKQYRDLKTVIKEESAKNQCRKFMQTGECHFGEHCTFTHYSRAELNQLISKAMEEEQKKLNSNLVPSTVDSWLEQRRKKLGNSEDCPGTSALVEENCNLNLPPSMQSVNYRTILSKELNTWG